MTSLDGALRQTADEEDAAERPTRCRYRCQMQTRSGMFAQYDGHVDAWCDTDAWHDVFTAAVQELRRTAFPDYSADMWKMLDFNRIG